MPTDRDMKLINKVGFFAFHADSACTVSSRLLWHEAHVNAYGPNPNLRLTPLINDPGRYFKRASSGGSHDYGKNCSIDRMELYNHALFGLTSRLHDSRLYRRIAHLHTSKKHDRKCIFPNDPICFI